jgi:hypothetical protein
MTDQELRYWDRLGMYVSRTDAEDFISKAGATGAVLDEDLEEFTPRSGISILAALEMEKTRPARVKELKAEGHTTEEAKEIFKQELDAFVRESLGLPEETEQEREYRERAKEIQENGPESLEEEE